MSKGDSTILELQKLADDIFTAVQQTTLLAKRPLATYRWQLNRTFPFARATELVCYLHDLGASHCYVSPYLKAVAGSMHGYDVVDHSQLNSEIGSPEDFQAFVAALRSQEMGHILDFVPNHMGVATNDNAWWWDILENGPSSRYATFFDIDWTPLKTDLEYKVLLPVLGDQFGRVLEDQQLTLKYEAGAFILEYFGRRFPVAPRSFVSILQHRLAELGQSLAENDPHFLEYQSILTALTHLPPQQETDPVKRDERLREKEICKGRLARLCDECPRIREFVEENVAIFNGRRGEPRSFDLLDGLLQDQAYRLAYWRVASDEINYRRFFDVNELAAVCMERREVFDQAHTLVWRLLKEEQLDGLRIDHADGLYDPAGYLWQLQKGRFLQLCRAEFRRRTSSSNVASRSDDDEQWAQLQPLLLDRFAELRRENPTSQELRPLYVLVEKILEAHERLPDDWPVEGSSGYEFLNDVNGLFVQSANAKAFDAIYSRFIGTKQNVEQLIYESKRLIMRVSMSSELQVLGHQLDRISERGRWTRDFTLAGQIQALREVVACFPVYRTYTTTDTVADRDRRYVEQAVARAKRRNPAVSGAVFDFVQDVLLLRGLNELADEDRRLRREFVGRFQQFTGPMMAKAVEDTAFYRFHRLVSLNEVGGSPERFGITVEEFHRHNLERQARRPFAMLTTSTHDTKRSEDTRARINVLSEIPDEWKRRVAQWARWNKRKKSKVDGDLAPARNDEYLLYQTLIGTWPFESPRGDALREYRERIQQYMLKAVREAKQFSSWIAPSEDYEQALLSFIEAILSDEPLSAFRSDFEPFVRGITSCGLWNSLSQTLLKLTSPGVPDVYQGTELWDFSLVDPDNRRPVDYEMRSRMLAELTAAMQDESRRREFVRSLVDQADDGRIKLLVTTVALKLRREHPRLFTVGKYIPLEVIGPRREHLCAFARQDENAWAIVLAPRWVAGLSGSIGQPSLGEPVWQETRVVLPRELEQRSLCDVWTRTSVRLESFPDGILVSDLLSEFPVGLFVSKSN